MYTAQQYKNKKLNADKQYITRCLYGHEMEPGISHFCTEKKFDVI